MEEELKNTVRELNISNQTVRRYVLLAFPMEKMKNHVNQHYIYNIYSGIYNIYNNII